MENKFQDKGNVVVIGKIIMRKTPTGDI